MVCVNRAFCFNCCQGRVASITLKVLIALCLIILISNLFYDPFDHIPRSCPTHASHLVDLEKLISVTHHVLQKFNVTHFLCYGTLWSALRREHLAPWDHNAEFCVLSSDMDKIKSKVFYKEFLNAGAHATYISKFGYYRIMFPNRPAIVKVILFVEKRLQPYEPMSLIRTGWSWKGKTDAFPKLLIDKPLPTKLLNGVKYPTPREGVEIQKYLYPSNWWFEVFPKECGDKYKPTAQP